MKLFLEELRKRQGAESSSHQDILAGQRNARALRHHAEEDQEVPVPGEEVEDAT